jgi:outer membrane protein TolC
MNKIALFSLLLPFVLLQTRAAFSQQLLTPEAAIAAAVANNYGILLAENEAAAGALDSSFAYGALLPRVNASLAMTLTKNYSKLDFPEGINIPDREGPERFRNPIATVALNWTLYDGMKMFITKDRLEEIARLGELNVKNQVVNTIADVTNNYFDIVRQKQQLKAIEEQMSVSEERVKVADWKLQTGLGSKPELLQAKVDLNAQKARQLQQQTLIAQRKEQLSQLAGGKLPTEFEVIDSIPFNENLRASDLQNNLARTNPSLLLAEKNIGIAQLTLRERKAERLPTVSLNSAFSLSSRTFQKALNPTAPSTDTRGFNIGLTASVPILNNMLTLRNIEQATLDIQYRQLAYAGQRTVLDANLRNAYRDYEYQRQALALEEENIELAKENVAIALERFRQGVSTYLELREAQKSLEDAYNRLIAARYNAKVAETELLRIRG